MVVVTPGVLTRFVSLALAGVLTTGASTAWSADLAIAPGTDESPAQVQAGAVAVTPSLVTPSLVPTSEAVAQASPEATVQAISEDLESGVTEATTTFVSLDPSPTSGPFEMNLFDKGDFMKQATSSMCVASSTQTMMNIIDTGEPNRSVADQKKLYTLGRQLTRNQSKLTSSGVDLSGWVALLNTEGYGRYVVESANTRAGAIRKAAKAIRETGKPVGLVVQAGRHAWVMSGFTATADPAYDEDFEVKAVYIQDPWYPSSGSVSPNTLVRMSQLKQDYLPYRRGGLYPKREDKFMLILPVLPEGTVAR